MDKKNDKTNASSGKAELKTDEIHVSESEIKRETDKEQEAEKVTNKERSCETSKRDSLRLLNAIKTHNFELVSTILENSPKLHIDMGDDVGKTPLHHLCTFGRSSEVALCLHRKPDVNKVDKIGWTPLHHAAMKGYTEVVKLLVDAGADANKPDAQKGRTPLHLAVWRNHQEITECLIQSGADVEFGDQDGKTAVDLCRNEFMKNKIETAVLSQNNSKYEIRESTIETMDISLDKPTPFPNLGLTVQPVTSEDTKATSRYGPDTLFTMSIRKTSADKVNDKFILEETEDVCSDIFTIKTTRTNGPTSIDIYIPIFTPPIAGEELVLKTDKRGQDLILTIIKEEDKRTSCLTSIDVTSLDSFVVVSRPKLEKFSVGTGAASLKSTVDDRVELNISKGTFDRPVTITMEITEPPEEDDLKRVMDQCEDITSLTSFYSLDSGGKPFSKPVSVKVPLPATYSGEGKLLLFTMNADSSRESPNSWELMPEANQIKKGRIEFEAPSFSVYPDISSSYKIIPGRFN